LGVKYVRFRSAERTSVGYLILGDSTLRNKGMFGCKSPPFHICSIRAPFSVARFVISGGYYRGSFEYVIKSIVQLEAP